MDLKGFVLKTEQDDSQKSLFWAKGQGWTPGKVALCLVAVLPMKVEG